MSTKEETTALKKIYEKLRIDDKVKSQREFAAQVSYHEFPISKMLLGTKPIPYALLVKLYNTFNVNINFLISGGHGAMFLNETEKITRKDLEMMNLVKEEIEELRKENGTLKRMIADKEKIIALLEKQKA